MSIWGCKFHVLLLTASCKKTSLALRILAINAAKFDNPWRIPTGCDVVMWSVAAMDAFTATTGFLSPFPEAMLWSPFKLALLWYLTLTHFTKEEEVEEEEGSWIGLEVRNNLVVAIHNWINISLVQYYFNYNLMVQEVPGALYTTNRSMHHAHKVTEDSRHL